MSQAPKWIQLNNEVMMRNNEGNFQFDKDKEAVKSYFIDHINLNTVFFHNLKEKLDYLVENDYYEKEFLDLYEFNEIKKLYKSVYSKKFRFPSFMSAYKFYNTYALKTFDGKKILERYEDRICATALYFAEGNIERANWFAKQMIERNIQPATPIFLNAGKKQRGEFVSCFLLMTDDSMNSIGHNINNALQLSKRGGGVSHNLTDLRSIGDPIKGIENRASGVVPVMKLLEDSYSYSNQQGARDGAGAAYYHAFGIDVIDFLSTKKINSDEKSRIKTLSLGLIIPDKFFELVEKDYEMYMFSPYDIQKEYGKPMSDLYITEIYDELVENPNIRKTKMMARDLLTMIAQVQLESGYPYLFFEENTNKVHPLANEGKVKFSNICTEVLQLSETSIINDYGKEDEIKRDISCILLSLNIVNVMENQDIEGATRSGVRLLDSVARQAELDVVPSVKKGNDDMRSIGIGSMNMHGFLAKNSIPYESSLAIEFTHVYFSAVNYYSLVESNVIAKEQNFIFRGFKGSDYDTGKYFDKYLTNDYNPTTPKLVQLFEGTKLPTKKDWQILKENIKKYGLAHSYRCAVAPTGSISYVQSSTASIAPITEKIEHRTYGDSDTYYPMPYMNKENFFYYKEAYTVDMYKMIDLYAAAQVHVDQGISCTLHLNDEMTTREISMLYIYAWMKGLKTLYYSRVKRINSVLPESGDACVSCVV